LPKFLDFAYFAFLKFVKMMMKRLGLLMVLIWYCIIGASVTVRDSIVLDDTIMPDIEDEPGIIMSEFSDNLDSLLNLWYVRNTPDSEYLVNYDPLADTIYPVYPDSFYIEQLRRIPSAIDLSYNRHVRSFINVYTERRREQVGVMLGLAEYYFPIFEEIFALYDMPLELKYCAIIESALNPRAVSRAGATGLWQFMYGTGRMYGLTINSFVDERRDPVKSTQVAARYMKDLYKIYGDWTLVIAAYNCGPTNVNKAIRRSGGKRNYWEIYRYLPRETRGHVPAFIAVAYLMNNYQYHNFIPRAVNLNMAVDTVMVNDELHLDQVSHVLNIPIQLLRDLNPQYKRDIIPGNEKPYALKIPVEYSTRFIDFSDSIYAFNDSIYFNKENKYKGPSVTTSSSYTSSGYVSSTPPANMAKLYYTVKTGDNLGFISEWYHVGLSQLKNWNNIYGSMIRTGQRLVVYVPKSKAEQFKDIDNMSFEEKQRTIGKDIRVPDSFVSQDAGRDAGEYVYYLVKPGETLWDIARKFPGVTDSELKQLNGITDAEKIQPGQVIKVQKKG
jgi:membrane-bound lytic murein transglycosylase D